MANKPVSPAEFARKYVPDISKTPAQRLADFLVLAAEKLPERYFTKPQAVKVAHALNRIPSDDHHYVKKMSSLLLSTRKALRERGKFLEVDRADGLRATVDMDDAVQTEYRKKRARLIHATENFTATDNLIEVGKIKSNVLQAEVRSTRRAVRQIKEGVAALPQLPPVKALKTKE